MGLTRTRNDCWALVPIKRRDECKSRLACLDQQSRGELVQLMLNAVLRALRCSQRVGRIAVVSPAPEEVSEDVLVLADSGTGLNAALNVARSHLLKLGAAEMVILPADLPFLEAADVDRLVDEGRRVGIAIAPDATARGTNGLYLDARRAFQFCFGEASFESHRAQSRHLGVLPAVVRSHGLEHDIDMTSDLPRLASHDSRFQFVLRH